VGVVVLPPVVGGVARDWGGQDYDVLTAVRQRELHEPTGLARVGEHGLLLLGRPVG
jgi:hypothetical protein